MVNTHCDFCNKPWPVKKFTTWNYAGNLPFGLGKNYIFASQKIPGEVWDVVLNLYHKYGIIDGHCISLATDPETDFNPEKSRARKALVQLREHLDPKDQESFPVVSKKRHQKYGWQLYHPQIALYLCVNWGSPWLRNHPPKLSSASHGPSSETWQEEQDDESPYISSLIQPVVEQPNFPELSSRLPMKVTSDDPGRLRFNSVGPSPRKKKTVGSSTNNIIYFAI